MSPLFFGGILAAFVEYDPLTGVETWADGDEANRLQVHYRQRTDYIKDYASILRKDGLTDGAIKKDMPWLYAVIPPVVIMELKVKYGVDIFKRDHLKRAFQLIESEYPQLKTTEKVHTLEH